MDIMLPKSLEVTLRSLLEENGLSSWTIQGSEHMTTVIIRFKMEAIATDHQSTVKYKQTSI